MKSRFTALLTAVFGTAYGAWFVLLLGSAFSDVTPLAAFAGAGGATLFVGAIVLRRIESAHASALDREAKETRRVIVASGKGLAHVTIRSARGEVALFLNVPAIGLVLHRAVSG